MKKATKIWLIIAALLVVLSGVVFIWAMSTVDWDFTKLSTKKYQTNVHDITGEFTDISISAETADIVFMPSEDGKCQAVCYEDSKAKHSVSVVGSKLLVNMVDTRKWHEHIGINFGSPKITVYLPAREYSSLKIAGSTGDVELADTFSFKDIDISTDTGDIRIEKVSASALNISVSTGKVTVSDATVTGDVTVGVSTGDVKLTDISCKNLISKGSTGEISLNNVSATGKFSIERSTGDVEFKDSDAGELYVETDTGDVKGTLLSDKVFITSTDTGKVQVPDSITGGRCEIKTDTGDIIINNAVPTSIK